MKAMPIRAQRINVMPMPRRGAGTLLYCATRSRMAAMAVMVVTYGWKPTRT